MKNRFNSAGAVSIRDAIEAGTLNELRPLASLTDEQCELQKELRDASPVTLPGIIIPFREKRDMTGSGQTSVPGDQGGMTIGTDVPQIGPALRTALRLPGLGATTLIGLTGNTNLPYGQGSVSAEWLAENATANDISEATGVLSLKPKRVSVSVPVSTQLIQQGGPAFLTWFQNDLMHLLATEIERVAIMGTGTGGEPTGILATSGISSVAGGTNGLAPTLAHLCDLEFAVAGTKKAIDGPTGWLLSPKARRKLRQTFVNGTGSAPLWSLDSADRLFGQPAGVTGGSPDTLTKGTSSGVCSAIIYGNFKELFVGLWGAGIGVEVVTNRALSIAGKVQVVAVCYVDCGVRNPGAFAAMQDALCA